MPTPPVPLNFFLAMEKLSTEKIKANDCIKDLQVRTSDEEKLERMVKNADPGRKGPILMDGTVGLGEQRDEVLRKQQGIRKIAALFKIFSWGGKKK